MTWETLVPRAMAIKDEAPSSPQKPLESHLPSGVEPPARPKVLVVDHFDLSMIDADISGAVLTVRPLPRTEAATLARGIDAVVSVINVRGLNELERELGMQTDIQLPKLGIGGKMLVMTRVKWNDVRWHLVEFTHDGDGCTE